MHEKTSEMATMLLAEINEAIQDQQQRVRVAAGAVRPARPAAEQVVLELRLRVGARGRAGHRQRPLAW